MRRAGLLARDIGAELTLLHVVDDDQPTDLVALETREAERILGEQIGAVAELRGLPSRALVIAGDPFDGILRAAASTEAGLIVMGAHRKQLLRDVFVGTTIERVIRAGPFPVLMLNGEVEQPYRTALAAIDLSEPSVLAMRTGIALGLPAGARLGLVHAFLPLAKGQMFYAGLSQDTINGYVADERIRATNELIAFLEANGLDDNGQPMCVVEEGTAFEVISKAVAQVEPDVLVMGTHGRSVLARMQLGSVTEEVLRSLDILAVPPVR
ncbi:universal stress protein [Microvirga lotononidis]|uniref:Universal stress protein UspA-like protein n=1 Tax=Microvirga lotononidis TaxID=864069 RepID=I4YS66_9HYPH|nr:universal stress protein [Microvirga lotononidis]EIM26808.1 universal stress protein UspA-like protein [Microvirga lotononidis]WQO31709.1 universal stress protein [Microvirga lotononidis]